MVAATKLQYEFRRRLNRLDSKFRKDFYPDEVDSYLNEAKDIVYSSRLDFLETSPKVKEELRQMEVKEVCLDCIRHETNKNACVVKLPENFFRKARYSAVINKGKPCGDKIAFARFLTSDKLTEALKDPFRKPSYEYEEVLMDEYSEGFIVFHNNEFTVKKVCIDYYRKLSDIFTPSLTDSKRYINSSGELIEVDNGLEIDIPTFWMNVVDIAVLNAARDLGAVQDFQTQLNKILTIEKY